MPRRLSEETRRAALAAYRRTGSILRTAREVGASASWVGTVVRGAGIGTPTPVFPASLVRRAVTLYVGQGLSVARVAEQLAREVEGDGPSATWVWRHLRGAGVLRSKRGAQRRRREKRNARTDAEAARQAVAMYDAGYSIEAIRRRLHVAHRRASAWIAAERELRAPSKAAEIRHWAAPTDAVRARLRRRARVIQLRLMGETYADIAADVGICPATVGNYLKAAGMVRARG